MGLSRQRGLRASTASSTQKAGIHSRSPGLLAARSMSQARPAKPSAFSTVRASPPAPLAACAA